MYGLRFVAFILVGLATAIAYGSSDPGMDAFRAGVTAFEKGELSAARKHFKHAAGLKPQWGIIYLQWGLVEDAIAPRAEVALELVKRSIQIQPDNPRAHTTLGKFLARNDNHAEAANAFRRALALRPSFLEAQFELGVSLRKLGLTIQALSAFERVVELNPKHTGAWRALAELHEAGGNVVQAERAFVAITRVQPNLAYNYYQLAQFYKRVGDGRKAEQALVQANRLDPQPQRRMRQLR